VVKEAAEFVVDHPGLVTTAAMVAGAVTWGLANFVFDAPEDYSTAEMSAEATIDSTLEILSLPMRRRTARSSQTTPGRWRRMRGLNPLVATLPSPYKGGF